MRETGTGQQVAQFHERLMMVDCLLLSFVPAGDLHHGVQQQCDQRHSALLQRDRAER